MEVIYYGLGVLVGAISWRWLDRSARRKARTETAAALEKIRDEAEGWITGATDATPEERAWMRVLVHAERGLNK